MIERVVIAAIAVLFTTPAFAGTANRASSALPVPVGTELVANVVNTCAEDATYVVKFKNPVNGAQLKQTTGSLEGKRGVAVKYSAAVARPLVSASVSLTCPNTAAPKPLVSVILQDIETGVPHVAGDVQEGTGI